MVRQHHQLNEYEFEQTLEGSGDSQVALVVRNPAVNVGDIRDSGSIPGSGRSPGGGHGNPLQCSCLENPMDRQAWQATVHRVAKSQIQLSDKHTHTHTHTHTQCQKRDGEPRDEKKLPTFSRRSD